MMNVLRNQTTIFDSEQWVLPVHIVGLGSIGSNVFFSLSRRGLEEEIHLWDDDHIEPHNIPTQGIYRPSDVGSLKVDAARAYAVRQEVNTPIVVHSERVTPDTRFEGVVVSGVDSMESRKKIWRAVRQSGVKVELYVDGRVGGESYQVHTLNPSIDQEVSRYEPWLFDDSDATQLPYGARVILDSPMALAAHIGAILTRFQKGEAIKSLIHHRLDSAVRA